MNTTIIFVNTELVEYCKYAPQWNTDSNKLVIFHLDDVTDDDLVPEFIHQLAVTKNARQPIVYMAVATVTLL